MTTEGGLDGLANLEQVRAATRRLVEAGIEVSLFIDASREQVEAARRVGAQQVEFHTGPYCHAITREQRTAELRRLDDASQLARAAGLVVNAGHGLNYHNVRPVAALAGMRELNIGHAIISRALMTGLGPAVAEMARLIETATLAPERFGCDTL